jgi:hypothetical protein
MAQATIKQFHIHDFTADEVKSLLSAVRDKLSADDMILATGEGQVRERMMQRVQEKVRQRKIENVSNLPLADQPTGLHVSTPIDKKMLDDWLRKEIKDLPSIGKYVTIVNPQGNPDAALRVRWEE